MTICTRQRCCTGLGLETVDMEFVPKMITVEPKSLNESDS